MPDSGAFKKAELIQGSDISRLCLQRSNDELELLVYSGIRGQTAGIEIELIGLKLEITYNKFRKNE